MDEYYCNHGRAFSGLPFLLEIKADGGGFIAVITVLGGAIGGGREGDGRVDTYGTGGAVDGGAIEGRGIICPCFESEDTGDRCAGKDEG